MHLMKKFVYAGAVTLLLGVLCGCGKGDAEKPDAAEVKEYTYQASYIELKEEDNLEFYNMKFREDGLYFMDYEYDQTTGIGGSVLKKYSLADKSVETLPFKVTEGRDANGYAFDAQGNVYTVEVMWEESTTGEYTNRFYLCKYDGEGKPAFEQDITSVIVKDEMNSYVNDICVDEQGRAYLVSESVIRLFNADGLFAGEVDCNNNWIQSIVAAQDGSVYISYYDVNSSTGGYVLAEIDFASKQQKAQYQNFPSGNGRMICSGEGKFLVHDGSVLAEYDKETQNTTELLRWLDCDINGSYVEYVNRMEDGRILAGISDWESGSRELALLSQVKTADLPVKQEMVIGTLYESQELAAAVIQFNKSSTTHRIRLKTYVDTTSWSETSYTDAIASLQADIVSKDNCPDMISLMSLDTEKLVAADALEDLTPFLEGSSVFSKEDFLPNVIEGYTYDGKLVTIPRSISVETVAARTSDVGNVSGWTMEQVVEYASKHPQAALFDYMDQESMMNYLMRNNQTHFIDWKSGKCSFDSDEFMKMLEFVAQMPAEIDWEDDDVSTPTKLQNGTVLLENVYLYDVQEIQQYEAMFDEPVTFIGYPTADGKNGNILQGEGMYAICSRSEQKEVAWSFMESMLAEAPGDLYFYGFPTVCKYFDAMFEEALQVEYVLDENGNPVLDDNGEPIVFEGMASVGYGDWTYTYHHPTQEEADLTRAIVESAVPASSSDTEVLKIIAEEAQAYYNGQKSVDDVAGIIQSRVQIYVNENQ